MHRCFWDHVTRGEGTAPPRVTTQQQNRLRLKDRKRGIALSDGDEKFFETLGRNPTF
ncbi:MAG: hypothetical protein WCP85_02080 [Mariniphaga sp.]